MRVQRTAILYVIIIGMAACWLYALLALLNGRLADGRLSTAGLLLSYPFAFGFSVMLRRLRWPGFLLQVIGWLGWAVALLLAIKFQLYPTLAWTDRTWLLGLPRAFADMLYAFRPELLILLTSVPLWWLGQRLAYLKVTFEILVGEFQLGMALLVITLVVNAALGSQPASSIAVALLFFMLSLLGLSVAHAMEGAGWLSGMHQGQWAGLLLASVGAVLAVGLIVGIAVTPDFLHLIMDGVKWVGNVILTVIAWLVNLLPKPSPSELPPMTPTPNMEPEGGYQLWSMSDTVRTILQLALAAIWIGLILFALWRVSTSIAAWLRRRMARRGAAEFESMPGAFRADLLDWLKRFLARLLSIRYLFRSRRKTGPALPDVASVRQTYTQFLKWAAARGWPRQSWQTPHEFFETLARLSPAARDDFAFITQEYVGVRYGPLRPTEQELQQLNESWRRIKRTRLKRPKGDVPKQET